MVEEGREFLDGVGYVGGIRNLRHKGEKKNGRE